MAEPSGSLRAEIAAEIAARGPIPFARYMELCLYHPVHGYYTRGLGGGGGRDYVTSSGLHGVYGLLIARQAEEMWRGCGRPDPFWFVEFGPGEGRFAEDFLVESARHAAFARSLRYVLVEASPVLAARQKALLHGRALPAVEWATEEEIDRRQGFRGILFANELLDAFPVHRVVGAAGGPLEVHVAAEGDALREVLAPLSGAAIARFLDTEGVVPEEGQEVDISLAAPCWLAWAVRLLRQGYVLLVDYGFEARDLYHPSRRRGTLLSYHRHRAHEDFLARPGEQDLTAHVDFTALRRAAETSGARVLGCVSQARLLIALGAVELLDAIPDGSQPGATTAPLTERLREREGIKELILPGRMGEKFHALVLGVGEVERGLRGLSDPWVRPGAAGAIAGASPRSRDARGGSQTAGR